MNQPLHLGEQRSTRAANSLCSASTMPSSADRTAFTALRLGVITRAPCLVRRTPLYAGSARMLLALRERRAEPRAVGGQERLGVAQPGVRQELTATVAGLLAVQRALDVGEQDASGGELCVACALELGAACRVGGDVVHVSGELVHGGVSL